MTDTMFRPAALRRISSPEQLDKAVRITRPRHWLALVALITVVMLGVVWSAVATVPTLISGPGFLLPREGLSPVETPIAGILDTLAISPGDPVSPGQVVAYVRPVEGVPVAVLAGTAGTVSEVDDAPGQFVRRGQRIALIAPDAPHVVYAYVPIRQAKSLPPGLPVRVNFQAGVSAAYGYAEGRVAAVSPYPVSEDRLRWVLHTDALVRQVQRLGPVDEVEVRLTPSARTPSGWVWASGKGPPAPVPAGLSADVQFVLGTRHPIDDVL